MRDRRSTIARNLGILLLVALPLSVILSFALHARSPQGWAAAHEWTVMETLSAWALEYVLSAPAFLVPWIIHQGLMLLVSIRTKVQERFAIRVGSSIIAFTPLMVSSTNDLRDFTSIASGVLLYSFLIRAIPSASGAGEVGD